MPAGHARMGVWRAAGDAVLVIGVFLHGAMVFRPGPAIEGALCTCSSRYPGIWRSLLVPVPPVRALLLQRQFRGTAVLACLHPSKLPMGSSMEDGLHLGWGRSKLGMRTGTCHFLHPTPIVAAAAGSGSVAYGRGWEWQQ